MTMASIVTRAFVAKSYEPDDWPFCLAPIRQLCTDGLTFDSPVTFIVGENGSGKSTLMEAIAEAYGIDVRGGHGGRRYASTLDKGPLGEAMQLELGPRSRRDGGFFLRAETAHGVFQFMSDHELEGYGDSHLGAVSHGEGYLQVLESRFAKRGLYLLDEPEAPLSFQSSLILTRILGKAVQNGSQVICATHSPLITALPGAAILELGEDGIRETEWEELDVVGHWRNYLQYPQGYLRHLLD